MEHRNGVRARLAVPASVEQRGKLLGRFRTYDISHGGVSLGGGVEGLQTNSVVTITFESDKLSPFATKALVVRQLRDRVGLMWVEQHGIRLSRLLPKVEG